MLLISSSFPTGLLPPQYPTQRDLRLVDESIMTQRSSACLRNVSIASLRDVRG